MSMFVWSNLSVFLSLHWVFLFLTHVLDCLYLIVSCHTFWRQLMILFLLYHFCHQAPWFSLIYSSFAFSPDMLHHYRKLCFPLNPITPTVQRWAGLNIPCETGNIWLLPSTQLEHLCMHACWVCIAFMAYTFLSLQESAEE